MRLNLVGKRFGKLTVVAPAGLNKQRATLWLCRCDCGRETTVIGGYLTFGTTRSCGCLKQDDLMGKRFGRLTVFQKGPIDTQGYVTWECRCDCGNEVVVPSYRLNSKRKQSCGCLSNKLPLGRASRNAVLKSYKHNAKVRGRVWELSSEEFDRLTANPCHYCSAPPSKVYQHSECRGAFTYNGIDRKDDSAGYFWDNVVPCCQTCNWAKGKKTYEEFMAYIRRLVQFQTGKLTTEDLEEEAFTASAY